MRNTNSETCLSPDEAFRLSEQRFQTRRAVLGMLTPEMVEIYEELSQHYDVEIVQDFTAKAFWKCTVWYNSRIRASLSTGTGDSPNSALFEAYSNFVMTWKIRLE